MTYPGFDYKLQKKSCVGGADGQNLKLKMKFRKTEKTYDQPYFFKHVPQGDVRLNISCRKFFSFPKSKDQF